MNGYFSFNGGSHFMFRWAMGEVWWDSRGRESNLGVENMAILGCLLTSLVWCAPSRTWTLDDKHPFSTHTHTHTHAHILTSSTLQTLGHSQSASKTTPFTLDPDLQ